MKFYACPTVLLCSRFVNSGLDLRDTIDDAFPMAGRVLFRRSWSGSFLRGRLLDKKRPLRSLFLRPALVLLGLLRVGAKKIAASFVVFCHKRALSAGCMGA